MIGKDDVVSESVMHHWQIAVSIWLSLAFYLAAIVVLTCGKKTQPWGRLLWTTACAAYLLHVAAAFHYYLNWSHAEAYEHTETGSGFGPGIYLTYAFTALWVVDVVLWWLLPNAHAHRPRWLSGAWHGLAAFMLFNGAVVFAQGVSRILGILVFASLAAILLNSFRRNWR